MWYLSSVFCLLIVLAIVNVAGAAFIDFALPWRLRPAAREFLAPICGLLLLLIPVTLTGWFGHGFRWWLCLPATLALGAAGCVMEKRRGVLNGPGARHFLRLQAFAVFASFPMLGQLLCFNTFNPFGDTWTYLYQAQWLQEHGYKELAVTSGHHPAAVAVLSWQQAGLRIVPSFLLGWLQAEFGATWSYELYPTAISLALICGALAVGAIVRGSLPQRRREAWWVALASGITLNGFAFGAVGGFFPQTMGLAFSTAALALRGSELAGSRARSGSRNLRGDGLIAHMRASLPMSGCVAAVVYCYPEVLPFLASALTVSYFLPWPLSRREILQRIKMGAAFALTVTLLASFELARAARAMTLQAHSVTGNPVAWSPWGFFAGALGLRSGIYEGGFWILRGITPALKIGAAPTAAFALLLLWSVRTQRSRPLLLQARSQKQWWLALAPALLMVGVSGLFFVYFRYCVANPWPNGLGPWLPGVGQSWSQFKLSLWVSPALLGVLGAVLVVCLSNIRLLGSSSLASLFLAVWCAIGLGWNAILLRARINPIRIVSGETQDPFGSYRAFCESLEALPKTDRIYLGATPGDYASIKQRELLAYFLSDHEVIGDWTIDDNIPLTYLPDAERKLPAQAADWVVLYHPPLPEGAAATPLICRLSVARMIQPGRVLEPVADQSKREHDPAAH